MYFVLRKENAKQKVSKNEIGSECLWEQQTVLYEHIPKPCYLSLFLKLHCLLQ